MTTYVTRDGDVLDEICRATYGDRKGATEAVLAANRGLAGRGPVLQGGVVIELPDLPAAAPAPTVRLWD